MKRRKPDLPRFQQNILHPADQARVLKAVRASPGVHLRAIARLTGLHPNVIRGYVQHLVRAGHVVERQLGPRILVYPRERAPNAGHRAVAADHELQGAEQRRLLAFIQQRPGLRQKDIVDAAQAWGWPRSTTQHRLQRLVEANLVHCDVDGQAKRYRP